MPKVSDQSYYFAEAEITKDFADQSCFFVAEVEMTKELGRWDALLRIMPKNILFQIHLIT